MNKEYSPNFTFRHWYYDGGDAVLLRPNRFQKFISSANDCSGLLEDAYAVESIGAKSCKRIFYQRVSIDTFSSIHDPRVNEIYAGVNKVNESFIADMALLEAGNGYKTAKHGTEWLSAMIHEEQHKAYLDPPDERRKLQELTDDFDDF
jgi:hypothetical protein